jgi:hypothetical protein
VKRSLSPVHCRCVEPHLSVQRRQLATGLDELVAVDAIAGGDQRSRSICQSVAQSSTAALMRRGCMSLSPRSVAAAFSTMRLAHAPYEAAVVRLGQLSAPLHVGGIAGIAALHVVVFILVAAADRMVS